MHFVCDWLARITAFNVTSNDENNSLGLSKGMNSINTPIHYIWSEQMEVTFCTDSQIQNSTLVSHPSIANESLVANTPQQAKVISKSQKKET